MKMSWVEKNRQINNRGGRGADDYSGLESIQCNMKTINYLDVTLDLENSTYRPYQKENN